MEVNARGQDTFGHLVGVTFYDANRYRQPEVSYSAFPGFHFLAIPLYKVTGIGYYELARILAAAFHVVRLAAVWYLAHCIFRDGKTALFFTILLLAFFWDHQQFDPSNQNMGMTLFLFVLAGLFAPGTLSMSKRLMLIIFYAATVITHPLSAMALILLLLFFVLAGLTGKNLGFNENIKGLNLFLFFVVGFVGWVLYTADWVLPAAVDKVLALIKEDPEAPTRSVVEPTLKMTPYAILVYSFLGMLLVWGMTIAVRKEFWGNLGLRRVFPALCIFPPQLSLLTGFWDIPRAYLIGAPFTAWVLAQERSTRKNLALLFLLISLGFFFVLRYYAEYVDYNPSEAIYGARFVAEKIPSSAAVYRGDRSVGDFVGLSNTLDVPRCVDTRDLYRYKLQPGRDFQYGLDSERDADVVTFYQGKERWEGVKELLASNEAGIIYSNGKLRLRAYKGQAGGTYHEDCLRG
jgi:hypothetical protein